MDAKPSRTWGAIGEQGLAVGFWNVAATAYARIGDHFALKTGSSYDYRFNQRLILQAQLEANWYSREDRERSVGSGLADIDSGLRLHYEISRKFAPYVGVTYQRFFGNAAFICRNDGGT